MRSTKNNPKQQEDLQMTETKTATASASVSKLSRVDYLKHQELRSKEREVAEQAQELKEARESVKKYEQRITDARDITEAVRFVLDKMPESTYVYQFESAIERVAREGNQVKDNYLPEAKRLVTALEGNQPSDDRI
jgi:hypothetical protein